MGHNEPFGLLLNLKNALYYDEKMHLMFSSRLRQQAKNYTLRLHAIL